MNQHLQNQPPGSEFAHYTDALWRRRSLIALIVVVAVLFGLISGFVTPALGDDGPSGSGSHEATGTIVIGNPEILPENDYLSSLNVRVFDRNGAGHALAITGLPVMQRAVAALNPDINPEVDPIAFGLAVTELQESIIAEPVGETSLIEMAVLADGEDAARDRLLVVVDAYRQILGEELLSTRESALVAVQDRLDRIEGSTPVAASVVSQLRRASRDLAAIDTSLSEQLAQIADIEVGITASVRETAGTHATDQSSVQPGAEAFPELIVAAEAIRSASLQLSDYSDSHKKNVSAAIAELQADDLGNAAIELNEAAQRTLGLFDELAIESSLDALAFDLQAYETSLSSLRQSLEILASISVTDPYLGAPVQEFRGILSSVVLILQNRVDTTEADPATVGEIRTILSSESVGAASTMQAVAGELASLLAEENLPAGQDGLTIDEIGRLSAAENRLRTAAAEMQRVESVALVQQVRNATGLLTSTGSQISALSRTLDDSSAVLKAQIRAGIITAAQPDAVGQTIRAANSSLQGVSNSLVTLRQRVSSGILFTELIAIDGIVEQVSISLRSTRDLSDDASSALQSLALAERQLTAELNATEQALSQAIATLDAGDVAVEQVRRSLSVQVESASESLADARGELSTIRPLGLPGTDIVGLVNLDLQMRSFSTDLAVLAELNAIKGNVVAVDNSVTETVTLIETVNLSTSDSDSRSIVLEADLRLVASASLLGQLSQQLNSVVSDNVLQDEVSITLSSQRLNGARNRINDVSDILGEIERPSDAEFSDLLTLQEEVESLISTEEGYAVSDPPVVVSQVSSLGFSKILEDFGVPMALAAVAGMMIAVIAVFTIEYFDRSVRVLDDFLGIGNLRPLGAVAVGTAKGNPHPPDVLEDVGTVFSESMQLVATEIGQILSGGKKSVLVSSPLAGDGRTAVVLNTAQVLVRRGKKVLLVDANFRKPDLTKILELENRRGLAECLETNSDFSEAVVSGNGIDMLPAGQANQSPVDLLSGDALASFLKEAGWRYDAVIVDGPPTLGFADGLVLGRAVDAVLMVTRAGVTTVDEVEDAASAFERSGAPVDGVVLNFAGPENFEYLEANDAAYGLQHRYPEGWLARLFGRLQQRFKSSA